MDITLKYNSQNTIVRNTIKGTQLDNLVDSITVSAPTEYLGNRIYIDFYDEITLIDRYNLTDSYDGDLLTYSVTDTISATPKVKCLINVSIGSGEPLWTSLPIYIHFGPALPEAPPLN